MLPEERKLQIFIELYTDALRLLTGNKWIQPPKPDTEKWKQLETAYKLVEEMNGDMTDFIRCQFNALSRMKIVPQPHHMCSTKAVERYLIYQKMKNKYYKKEYCIEGDKFIVYETNKEYPIKQVDLSTADDPDASYAFYIANNNTEIRGGDLQHAIETICYTIAKLRYKNKVPTESLLRKLKEIKNETSKK